MSYVVRISRSAEREMDKLPEALHARLVEKIQVLEVNPIPRGAKKLSGREEYRLRVGDYRVLYTTDHVSKSVTVSAVAHRREVYR